MDIRTLDRSNLHAAAELVARQQRAARSVAPTSPTELHDPVRCAELLGRLLDDGHQGHVALDGATVIGVLVGRADGAYATMPAEGFAVDPDTDDATQVLGRLYAPLATDFVAAGALRHYLDHVAAPGLADAVADMGFGRHHYFAIRDVGLVPARRREPSDISVRIGGIDDLETIARLCMVEIAFRSTAPVFSPPEHPTLEEVIEAHRVLHDDGATHFIASIGGDDVGVLTLEVCREMPALCAVGQPFIGETGTREDARGRGVGSALVEEVVAWSMEHGHGSVSVDFQPPNPLSRRFWLGAGFTPTGYGVMRTIHPSHAPV